MNQKQLLLKWQAIYLQMANIPLFDEKHYELENELIDIKVDNDLNVPCNFESLGKIGLPYCSDFPILPYLWEPIKND